MLGEFSAIENVMVPQMIRGLGRAEARRRAAALLRLLGLAERAGHRPAALSGGEQQRVATHNLELASRMDRRVTLRDGKVVAGD